MVRLLPFICLLLFPAFTQGACFSQTPKAPECMGSELLVKFKPGVARGEAESLHRHLGSKIINHVKGMNLDVVKIKEGWTAKEAIDAYQDDPRVEYAEPNYSRKTQPGR